MTAPGSGEEVALAQVGKNSDAAIIRKSLMPRLSEGECLSIRLNFLRLNLKCQPLLFTKDRRNGTAITLKSVLPLKYVQSLLGSGPDFLCLISTLFYPLQSSLRAPHGFPGHTLERLCSRESRPLARVI